VARSHEHERAIPRRRRWTPINRGAFEARDELEPVLDRILVERTRRAEMRPERLRLTQDVAEQSVVPDFGCTWIPVVPAYRWTCARLIERAGPPRQARQAAVEPVPGVSEIGE
jgi:hypothetical protein